MSKFQVGDRIITPALKVGQISSVHPKISITWENGLSAEYTPKQLQAWNYRKFLEDEEASADIQNSSRAGVWNDPNSVAPWEFRTYA